MRQGHAPGRAQSSDLTAPALSSPFTPFRCVIAALVLGLAVGLSSLAVPVQAQWKPGSAGLDWAIEAVPTIPDMLSATPPARRSLLAVEGYLRRNDGGGGFFQYDPRSRDRADNVLVFEPKRGSGRYHRVLSSRYLPLEMAGIALDGRTRRQGERLAALTEAARNRSLVVTAASSGELLLDAPWDLRGVFVELDQIDIVLAENFARSGSTEAIQLGNPGSNDDQVVQRLTVDGNRDRQRQPVTAFVIRNDDGPLSRFDLRAHDVNTALRIDGNAEVNKVDLSVYQCDLGVVIEETDQGSPDEIELNIQGKNCGQWLRDGGNISYQAHFNVEQGGRPGDWAVEVRSNKLVRLGGLIRGINGGGVFISEKNTLSVHFDDLVLLNSKGTLNGRDGGRGGRDEGWPLYIRNARRVTGNAVVDKVVDAVGAAKIARVEDLSGFFLKVQNVSDSTIDGLVIGERSDRYGAPQGTALRAAVHFFKGKGHALNVQAASDVEIDMVDIDGDVRIARSKGDRSSVRDTQVTLPGATFGAGGYDLVSKADVDEVSIVLQGRWSAERVADLSPPPGTVVEVLSDGGYVGGATLDKDGRWVFNIPQNSRSGILRDAQAGGNPISVAMERR